MSSEKRQGVTDFSPIADVYLEVIDLDILTNYCEEYTFLKVLGDLSGQTTLDLACGNGYYTRRAIRLGARSAVGVDIAEDMIQSALGIEKESPMGIEYLVRDAAKLEKIGQFDVATAVYLFPHAWNKQDLASMFAGIYKNLKPGGRLVALVRNPHLTNQDLNMYEKYGIYMRAEGELKDGTIVAVTVDTPSGSVEFQSRQWTQATFEDVMTETKFHGIVWHPIEVSPEAIRKYGESFWEDFQAKPRIAVFECWK